ncbi:MAG: DUF1573 domain-containing protein [Bacteroidetes bacterium]|nr:DUF1573 domain-containing protein [Bacteroidota bacterium]
MMKLIFFLLGTCIIISSCDIRRNDAQNASIANAGGKANIFTDTTTVQVIDSVYNFGKVTDGENVVYNYRFKNNGTKPLVISQATASCGCTVPEKPEEPIKPGETGFLKVVFNSKGRVGPVHKEVTVISNAYPAFPVLQLTGEVVSPNK